MAESRGCTKVRTWQEGDASLYRVAFDGVEAASIVRRYYSKWILERQAAVDRAIRATWTVESAAFKG